MKKTLLTGSLIAFAFGAFAQFTAGRLVVSQYGDGVNPLPIDGTTVPVFLKEYKVIPGASTKSVAMPTDTIKTPTPINYPFTGLPTGSNEGLISLSPDGNLLSMYGYGITVGKTLAGTDVRTIALVKADESINTTTGLPGGSTVANARSAITVDGSAFWIASSGGGVRYTVLGSSSTAAVNSSPLGAMRSVNIFNGQLYESTNSNSAGAYHIGAVGSGLPTSGPNASTAPVALPGLEGSSTVAPTAPNQVVFLKTSVGTGAPDLIYNTNDGNGTIEKWVLTSGTWVNKGALVVTADLGALSVKGITARIIGDTSYVYANTADKLIAIRDTLSANKTISVANTTITLLATAPANTIFKGVAFTPGTNSATVLPIKLSSFTGKSTLNGVQLSWATASEKNNNYFDVLRSTDGKAFNKIEEVAGNGNSDVALTYSFLDRTAAKGANYYKLNQVDNNGKSEEFGPVAVTVNGQPADLSVYANKASGQIKVNVYANQVGNALLNIFDANGRVIASQNVNLNTGNNEITLNIQSAGAGLHIASLSINGLTLTKKFMFQ
nr:T9SS type A sorting domain-containing protein [uncultured Pedobacter sp.]